MSLPSYLPAEQRGLENLQYSKDHDEQQMIELLNYYRHKIDGFEKEQVEWLGEIEQMRYDIEQAHVLEDGVLQRKMEIAELQKAMSDSHLAVYDEKNTVNNLRLQYEDLAKQEKADMRRIRELKALQEDISQKSTTKTNQKVNFKDCRPQYSKNAIPLSKQEKAIKNLGGSGKKKPFKPESSDMSAETGSSTSRSAIQTNATGGIVKTVILPFDEINNLKKELEYLKQYKEQQKALFEASIQGYQKDKIIRLQESKLKEEDIMKTMESLQTRMSSRDKTSYDTSKEYFAYKHQVQKSKDMLSDEKELLLVEKRMLEDQLGKLRETSGNDQTYAVELYDQKTESFAQRFRNQAQTNENDLKVIKAQYSQVQQKYMDDIKQNDAKLAQVKDKIKIIEARRMTEQQAFTGDIQSIKKRVIDFERYIKKLKQHVDEEKTTELIQELENTDAAQIDMDQLIGDIRKIENEVKDAKRFKLPNYNKQ